MGEDRVGGGAHAQEQKKKNTTENKEEAQRTQALFIKITKP